MKRVLFTVNERAGHSPAESETVIMADTSVVVATIPDCDLCKQVGVTKPAYADASLTLGSWGYVCLQHFNEYGKGLGLGRGQRLLLEGEDGDDVTKRVLSEQGDKPEEDEDDGDPVVDTEFVSVAHEAAAKYLSDLIRKRDEANGKIPLSDSERRSWDKRIAKAAIIMNTRAIADRPFEPNF
jgi:hypothetical protein